MSIQRLISKITNVTGEINMRLSQEKIKSQQTTTYSHNIYKACDWQYCFVHMSNNETLMKDINSIMLKLIMAAKIRRNDAIYSYSKQNEYNMVAVLLLMLKNTQSVTNTRVECTLTKKDAN